MNLKVIGIIPARYASSRFPGKPLVDISGKSMIQRVYEQAQKATSISKVIVATDDDRIMEHVKDFGGEVIMTASSHQSGTDRCAEVLQKLGETYDIAINIQGDEPFINPKQIDLLVACFEAEEVQIATLVKRIGKEEDLANPNKPKVVLDKYKNAIYFSRHAIPFNRSGDKVDLSNYYQHIGIYGFQSKVLNEITQLSQSHLEKMEALEQLRWIENGYKIRTAITDLETIAIDTPEDLEKLANILNNN